MFALVAGFVALAAVGAAVGWAVTKGPKSNGNVVAGSSPSASVSLTPSAPHSPSSPPVGQFVIPDFAQFGADFRDARTQLITQKLGVTLYFGFTTAGDGTVSRTFPLAGTPVDKGRTIKVYVNGPAPVLTVPSVLGQACANGGKLIAAAGLSPRYASGKNGLVAAQNPGSDSVTTRWNDSVSLTCTSDGSLPSSPPVSPPSSTPSSPDGSTSPEPTG